jgi:hypothetical protein
VLVIAVVVGIVLHQLSIVHGQTANSSPHPAVLTLTPPSLQRQDCLRGAAWSPNGSEIAVLGYRDHCANDFPSNYDYEPGVLHIYSSSTGRLIQTILPDAAVQALPGAPTPGNVQPESNGSDVSKTVLYYLQVLWSPNGKQLALTFYISRWSGQTLLPGYDGLVLVNADGTHERAALYRETGQQYGGLRWDTTSMSFLVLPDQSHYGSLLSVAPGTRYTWSADGRLVPSGSLAAASSSSTGPVGNPDGGSSFTIWQPGSVLLSTQAFVNNQTVSISPGVYSWGTTFVAWSPDGRYLINPLSLVALLHPAGQPHPTAAELRALGWEETPSLAIPGPAFQQLLNSLPRLAALGRQAQVDMAWSPNGRILAAIPDVGPTDAANLYNPNINVPRVTLYDSVTGNLLETLPTLPSSNAPANSSISSSSFLQWSADGSHLLVFNDQLDTITVWGPSRLPHTA